MKTVLLVCGGRSEEHEISLISAKGILGALDRTQYRPLVVGISRKGEWFLEEEESFYLGEARADRVRLNEQAPGVTLTPNLTSAGRAVLLAAGKSHEFDVVFPILHGPYGEDGRIQGLLEMIGVPFVGAGCGSSWMCMDKSLTKTLCQREGIRVAPFVTLNAPEEFRTKEKEIQKLNYPLFVKPARLGSSVGISKVIDAARLSTAIELAFKCDSKILVEQGIQGREIECGVMGLCRQSQVATPAEIIPNKNIGWYSYEAKYLLTDGASTIVPAALEASLSLRVIETASRVFDLLECDGMARVDFFVNDRTSEIWLNEINTIPGFTPISLFPKMWASSGVGYTELVTKLIELAFEKARIRP